MKKKHTKNKTQIKDFTKLCDETFQSSAKTVGYFQTLCLLTNAC